jgi:4-hydroxybenzoate polyprenyltransferase
MNMTVTLQLGRVSNLPTVWSNVLVGTVLAGGQPWAMVTVVVMIAVSLLYVGGMYLNDAFDHEIDARERPNRPIPAGLVAVNTVFAAGFGMLLAGIAGIAAAAALALPGATLRPVLASVALAAAIVFYDWNHKGNALSPLYMGLCRVLAYVTAGYVAVASPDPVLWVVALVGLSYLIGLTYIAKQESLDQLGRLWPLAFLAAPVAYGLAGLFGTAPTLAGLLLVVVAGWIVVALDFLKRRSKGDVLRAVVSLIAGISLVDGLFLAVAGATTAAVGAVLCFLITLGLQRWISGT